MRDRIPHADALVAILRLIGLLGRGHRAVALENLSLRQQLAALTRTHKRPQVRTRDPLFWVCLASAWRGWRTALVVVHPDTSCVGIANGSAACGRGATNRHRSVLLRCDRVMSGMTCSR